MHDTFREQFAILIGQIPPIMLILLGSFCLFLSCHLFEWIAALIGFVIGFVIGMALGSLFDLFPLAFGVALGIAASTLVWRLQKVAVFIVSGAGAAVFVGYLLGGVVKSDHVFVFWTLIIFLVCGGIAATYYDPLAPFAATGNGAAAVTYGLFSMFSEPFLHLQRLLGWNRRAVVGTAFLLVMATGVAVQFYLDEREKERKEAAKSPETEPAEPSEPRA